MTITIDFSSMWVIGFLVWAIIAGILILAVKKDTTTLRGIGYLFAFFWPITLIMIPVFWVYGKMTDR